VGVERHTFHELLLSYYRARNHLRGAERDIDTLRRDVSDTVDQCWTTVDDTVTLQVRPVTHARTHAHTHTHTHTHPFNGPLSSTTRVSPYPKGKANPDFTEARDSEWQWHQLGCMQLCILLQTDNPSRTPPLSFLQAGCPFCRPTNCVKALVMHYKSNFAKNFTVPSFINFQMLHRMAQNMKTRKILSKEV